MSSLDPQITGVEFDLAYGAAFDAQPLAKSNIACRCRDITQMLVNRMFSLPRSKEQFDIGRMIDLPKPITRLPRSMPLPQAKPLTKWEKFAASKGINKKKKDRMTMDEVTGEVRPSWGYKRAGTLADVAFLPAKPTDVPGSDPFYEAELEKKHRVKTNLKQHQANIDRSKPTAGDKRRVEIENSVKVTALATASMGKFNQRRKGEPEMKRKNDGNDFSSESVSFEEKTREKKLLSNILNKRETVDRDKAANIYAKTNKVEPKQRKGKSSGPSKKGGKSRK
ncbi:hypothetical protein RCL1_003056 [Eukaryota sp. TZLM3-RCL]